MAKKPTNFKFSDLARNYYDLGLNVIPCENKVPLVPGWTKWGKTQMSEEEINQLEIRYGSARQMGLVLGSYSKIAAFDFDYEINIKSTLSEEDFEKDKKMIEKQILALLPPSPVVKIGNRGWTRFYKVLGEAKNTYADRHGIRLFDFLYEGKQCILPPSAKNKDSEPYAPFTWGLSTSLTDCIDDLPDITQDIVEEIKFLFSEVVGSPKEQTRHSILFNRAASVVKIEPDDSKVALDLVAYDSARNNPAYLSDKKHHRSAEPIENAMKWIKRIRKWSEEKNKSQGKKKPPIEPEGWDYFFKSQLGPVRKDILTKKLFTKNYDGKSEEWQQMDSLILPLKSYAKRKSMPYHDVAMELGRFQFEEKNLEFLCDIEKWDGRDHVAEMASYVKSDYFTSVEIGQILKRYGTGVFARIDNTDNQNECPILQGGQGIGKDTFIGNFFSGFKPYYKQIPVQQNPKDWYEIISRAFICHIPEFDQTAKLDVSFLKAMITQPTAFFRESYGTTPVDHDLAVSFITSVNPNDFFRDATGNRRFIVVPLTKIDWNYPKNRGPQIIAQLKETYDASGHYKFSDELKKKVDDLVAKLTPESNERLIEELYVEKWIKNKIFKVDQDCAMEWFKDIARKVGVSEKKVRVTISSLGYRRRNKTSRYYVGVKEDDAT